MKPPAQSSTANHTDEEETSSPVAVPVSAAADTAKLVVYHYGNDLLGSRNVNVGR